MKKIIVFLLTFILICPPVLAANQQGINQGLQGEEGEEVVGNQNQQQQELKAQTREELKEIIAEEKEELKDELEDLKESSQKVYQNQNAVREAVQALLAAENLIGGIGPQVSAIAREFNNSVQATIKAEERIQERSRWLRFFVGGDEQAATEIEDELGKNQSKIQLLKQLAAQCNCVSELKNIIQEQIQNIDQEQNRLREIVTAERKSKGVFGWLFAWLGKK